MLISRSSVCWLLRHSGYWGGGEVGGSVGGRGAAYGGRKDLCCNVSGEEERDVRWSVSRKREWNIRHPQSAEKVAELGD